MAQGKGDMGIGETGFLITQHKIATAHGPDSSLGSRGLGGRIYRLPPLPPTPSILRGMELCLVMSLRCSVALCCFVLY